MTLVAAIWNRERQWNNTLESLRHWYGENPDWLNIVLIDDDRPGKWRNPCVLYNQAARQAKSDVLFLTNPENLHLGPVLDTARQYCRDGIYVVFGCRSLKEVPETAAEAIADPERFTDPAFPWFQHSQHRNACFHFATAITKNDWGRVGGFDPAYNDGVGYDDTDFVKKVLAADMRLYVCDNPCVGHQPHVRYDLDEEGVALTQRNRFLFEKKWGPLQGPSNIKLGDPFLPRTAAT